MQNDFDSDFAHPARDPKIEFFLKLQAVSPTTPASRYFNVTNAIIALNIVAFIAIVLLGGGLLGPSDEGMLVYARYGASNASATTNGEWWRLVTSMFMHYGVIHIAVNMWALHQVGIFFEKLQGRALYALTYLACGIAGGFASIIWNADHPVWSAGASGAIFGIFGGVLGYMLRNRNTLPAVIHGPIIKSTVVFAIYNIGFGAIVPGIDLSAHIGGFVCGAIYGLLFAQSLEPDVRARRKISSLTLAVALLAVLVIAGINTAPSYNYSAAEEMEWASVNQVYETKANTLDRTRLGAAGAARLSTSLLPVISLYDDWINANKQMRFDPALLTAKRQALMINTLQKRLENWRESHHIPLVTGIINLSVDVHDLEDTTIVIDFQQQLRQLKPQRLR